MSVRSTSDLGAPPWYLPPFRNLQDCRNIVDMRMHELLVIRFVALDYGLAVLREHHTFGPTDPSSSFTVDVTLSIEASPPHQATISSSDRKADFGGSLQRSGGARSMRYIKGRSRRPSSMREAPSQSSDKDGEGVREHRPDALLSLWNSIRALHDTSARKTGPSGFSRSLASLTSREPVLGLSLLATSRSSKPRLQ